jgi:ribonuclease HI
VYAIKACPVENRNYRNRNSYVLSDSQAPIKALHNYQVNSKLVCDCHQSLTKLAKHNKVQLIWVQGPKSTEVNETADQLAKLGYECPFIGPEPACNISVRVAKTAVRDWTETNKNTGSP